MKRKMQQDNVSTRVDHRLKDEDLDDKILLTLRALGHKIPFLYKGENSQRRALILLKRSGSVSQRELTRRLSIKPGSMSEVLTKLTNKGFIKRTPSEDDKRTMIVSLTEKGAALAESATEYRSERRHEMFAGLEDEEKRTLLDLLEKVNNTV